LIVAFYIIIITFITPRLGVGTSIGLIPAKVSLKDRAIVTAGFGAEAPGAWRGLDLVPAVRFGRIYSIDPDLLYGQGPRFLEGARVLCRRLESVRN